jgi:NAD(P)-dependent dehydrogenase (short-subunit alcohol dehydrogenase family)
MAGTLEGKVILVTGGGSGIGRATSLLIAKQGGKVMIGDYLPEGAEKTVAMIKEAGGIADCVAADVSVAKQVDAMVAKPSRPMGGSTVPSTTLASKARWAPIPLSPPRTTSIAPSRSTSKASGSA